MRTLTAKFKLTKRVHDEYTPNVEWTSYIKYTIIVIIKIFIGLPVSLQSKLQYCYNIGSETKVVRGESQI